MGSEVWHDFILARLVLVSSAAWRGGRQLVVPSEEFLFSVAGKLTLSSCACGALPAAVPLYSTEVWTSERAMLSKIGSHLPNPVGWAMNPLPRLCFSVSVGDHPAEEEI